MNEQTQKWQTDFHNWHREFWSQKKFAPAALDIIGWISKNQTSIASEVAAKKDQEVEKKREEIFGLKAEIIRLRARKPFWQRLQQLWQ